MKLTLLDIVQDIANDLETDEINSINDTVESIQIAQIVKTTFFEMMAHRNWPHLKRTFQLDATVATTPTHMKLPVNVKEVVVLSYDKKKVTDTKAKYQYVTYLENEEFLRKLNNLNSDNANIDIITDINGIDLLIRTDKAPEWYTSLDDEHVVFDSYDSAVDTSLQTSKTQVIGYVSPSWTTEDTFTPDLPEEAFPALLEEAKSTAFVVLKQEANQKAEQKAQRQHKWLSRKAWRVKGGIQYPNYGRKRTLGNINHNNPLLDKDN